MEGTISTEQLNGNAPTQPVDLEVEHDVHNTSTLLASEKRNGVRKKVSVTQWQLLGPLFMCL